MNSILATEKGLPPGLWLPTAEESTEQYLLENFDHLNHSYEHILDYGAFVVAMAVLGDEASERLSFMPTQVDMMAMYDAGYGISTYKLKFYGGIRKLQHGLGYYPDGYNPTVEELLNRFQWIANHAYEQEDSKHTKVQNIEDILKWGADRNLTPAINRAALILKGNTAILRKMFQKELYGYPQQLTTLDLYRFGSRVIHENDGPISREALNRKYKNDFVGSPYVTIEKLFGSYTKFWMEFNYVPSSYGLTKQVIANLGVQWAITNGRTDININSDINPLSKDMRFPSRQAIRKHFKGNAAFREQIEMDYAEYERLRNEFLNKGVSDSTFKVACQKFEASPEFATWLTGNQDTLIALSSDSKDASYILKIMQVGFNLDDEVIFNMQIEDVKAASKRLGIISKAAQRFIFDLIPRINADEVLGL